MLQVVLQVGVQVNVTSQMREKRVEEYLAEQWATVFKGWCIKFPPIFFAGFPDRICLAPGALIVFVETKAPGKMPRPLQARIHATLRRWGFEVLVLDTFAAVDKFIYEKSI